MDLKGSLEDTRLKIFPSETLVKFLKTLPKDDDIPKNILEVAGKKGTPTKNGLNTVNSVAPQLSNKDIRNLEIIKNIAQEKVTEEQPDLNNSAENGMCSKDGFTEDTDENSEDSVVKETKIVREGPYLCTSDIDWIFSYLQKRRTHEKDVPYLHTLLEGCHIETPQNTVLKRNPELEARCVKLRAQQQAREYRKMTKGVDNVRMNFPEDSIAFQMKQLNRQLIAIGQFIISIFAGFLFGFKGVEWTIGELDFGFRLLLGVMCALIIALAEIYFLAKKLNEELNVPETTQLGGPPKFVDDKRYGNETKKVMPKPHQD